MLGFDLGSNELKIASWDGKKLSSLVSVLMPDNMIKSGSVVSYDALADFIKETLKEQGIRGKDASVVLPSGSVYLRRSVIPFMDEAQIRVNLPYEFKDFLTMDKSKYWYAYTVNSTEKDEEGKDSQMDLTAAAVAKDTIDEYRYMFRRAGLRLKYAIPSEIAFSNLLSANNGESKPEYCILDLGHSSTQLEIFTGSVFETTRSMDLGLADADERIAAEFGVDRHIAHAYKESNFKDVNSSASSESIYRAIASDARRAINFYGLSNRNSNIEDVYLAGGGSAIPQLASVLEEELALKVHAIADLFPPVSGEVENLSKFASAVGAAMAEKFNLAQKEKSQFRPLVLIPSLIVVLGLVGLFGKFAVVDRFEKLSAVQAQLSMLRSQESELESQLADYDQVAAEYRRYSVGWMTDAEKGLIFKSEVLKLVEDELASRGRVTEIASSGNTVTCKVAGISLDDASLIVNKLYEKENVSNVSVSRAESEKVPYVYKVVNEAGEESEQSVLESVISITVQMKKVAEEGKNNA